MVEEMFFYQNALECQMLFFDPFTKLAGAAFPPTKKIVQPESTVTNMEVDSVPPTHSIQASKTAEQTLQEEAGSATCTDERVTPKDEARGSQRKSGMLFLSNERAVRMKIINEMLEEFDTLLSRATDEAEMSSMEISLAQITRNQKLLRIAREELKFC